MTEAETAKLLDHDEDGIKIIPVSFETAAVGETRTRLALRGPNLVWRLSGNLEQHTDIFRQG